jgi:subtilisin family serine protease
MRWFASFHSCNGHGTHVAGIIGADPGNKFGIQGVSYGASIAAYRVFGCKGSVTDDSQFSLPPSLSYASNSIPVIIDALLRGNSDGMDILTLSLGGSDGWTESSSSVVASRLASRGKVVTIAAGNDGAYGSWYTSSPGNGIDVISVASVDK